jgi:glycosyltransferase involved in cell wall biosynthesis
MSSAIVALNLKKALQKPWVMHLSDPWADSPLYKQSKLTYNINKRLESRCFQDADKICFTSDMTLEFYSKLYPSYKNKFEVYPNVFDPADVETANNRTISGKKLKIVHTGGLTGKRSPIYLFSVIKHLKKTGYDVDNNLDFVFAGDADRLNRNIINNNNEDCFHYLGRVSFNESKKLQGEAHLLLCIEDPLETGEMAMFFPSKILDYITAGKKFFALTSPGSQLSKIFDENNWPYFHHNNLEAISQFLKTAVSELQQGNSNFFRVEEKPEKFSALYNAERLNKLFRELCRTSI